MQRILIKLMYVMTGAILALLVIGACSQATPTPQPPHSGVVTTLHYTPVQQYNPQQAEGGAQ